ncbi:MAG: sulfate transporter family protein [Rhizobiaceae bacterium]|nr:sulfate transporter family protein [Rhizobiaceae bacterium]
MSEQGLIGAILKTLSQMFSPPFRSVLWKSLGLTIALFVGFWIILQAGYGAFLAPMLADYSLANTMLAWLLGAGLVLGMGFLVAPVSSVFAGVFLDEIADEVETIHYPGDPGGRPLGITQSIGITARFFGLVVVGNLIALMLVLFLGLGVLIFFLLNGYLLGREYFQFAALRHRSLEEVTEMQKRFGSEIFFAGLAIAVVLIIPIVNFLTPLFAGALMVHVYKRIERKSV